MKAKSNWQTTKPPKRKNKPVRLRYQNNAGHKYQGNFVWSDRESTWVECIDGPDGLGLYEDDGWKVLGWKEPTKK